MKGSNRRLSAALQALLPALASVLTPWAPALAAAPAPAATIGDLAKAPPAVVETGSVAEADPARAMDNYRRFLELQRTDPALRAEAMRRLADLNQEAGSLERLDQELSQVDRQGAEAIRLYTQLLQLYPDYPHNDQVLYQLARAYETTGRPEQALATLERLVAAYPRSPLLGEAQFRRGELLFSARRYADAAAAYAVVIKQGPASAFYQQALYKQGWSLFKQSLGEDSLPAFAGVLDQVLLGGRRSAAVAGMEQLSRASRELAEDTLRVMSITFANLDGARSVDAFVQRSGNPPYAYLLYSRLGDLYVDKQRYQDAASAYRAFVARDAIDPHAPELAMRAIEAYRSGGFTDLVLDGKRDYVEHYNFKAPFWQGRVPQDYPKVAQELQTNLKDVATWLHAEAQKSKQPADYQQAARWYRSYLESFPAAADAADINYRLADALFASHDYAQAAVEYDHTAYGYPGNAVSATAAQAALVSYQKGEEVLSGADKQAWHRQAVDAGVKFARAFPAHPDSPGVLVRAAEDLYGLHELPRAIEVSELLLARNPPADAAQRRIAWSVVGQSQFDQGVFDQAEGSFEKARELAAGDAGLRADLTERIATAVYRQGEARQQAGDAGGAVEAFLRVASVAPDSKVAATSQYDAAAQLINLKQWERAVTVLQDYRRRYPQSERAPDVTRKLAVAYAEANHPGDAAVEFERIAESAGEAPDVRHEALTRAIELYDRTGNAPKTTAMLESLVAQYPAPVPEAMEAREHLARIAGAAGDAPRQQHWLREMVRADADAGAARTDRTRYLAATAQLQLAQPARDAFRGVRLVAPLKKSLAAKRTALDQALAAYKAASDYNVAAVTTAATFETAELYRTLGRDVLASERPKNLSKDELEQYQSLLEDQAFPFEEDAIRIHEVNAARARDGLYDDWVKRSYEALAQLKPGRYGKTELTAPQAAQPPAAGSAADLTAQGISLRQAGRFQQAAEAYHQAIAVDAGYAPAYRNLAVVLDLYLGDTQAAFEAMQRYQELDADAGQDRTVKGWVADLKQRAAKAAAPSTAPQPAVAADKPGVQS